MEYFRPEVKVGALIFVSLVLLVFAALTIGNLGAWFAEQHTYTVLFPNASLLHRRAKVAYAGFPVGEVTAIEIRDLSSPPQHGYPVAVTVVVDASVPVREDARIELKTDGFIGDRFLDILPGTGNVLPAGSTIHGAIGGIEGTLSSVVGEGVDEILKALRILLADSSQPNSLPVVLGSLRQLADDLRPRLTTTLAALEILLSSLKTEFATLNTSVTRDVTTLSSKGSRALERLEKTVAESGDSLQRLTRDLRTSLGAVQKTLATTDTVLSTSQNEFVPLLRGLQDLSARLQQDSTATLARLQQVLTHVDAIVVQNDRNIYTSIENLRDTLDNLKGASQQVRANPAVLIFGTRNQPDTNSVEAPSVTRTLQDRGRIGRYDKVQ